MRRVYLIIQYTKDICLTVIFGTDVCSLVIPRNVVVVSDFLRDLSVTAQGRLPKLSP